MSNCASWNPVSINDPQPYYPDYKIPPKAELDKMNPKEFNKWRTKAKHLLLAFFQKKWRYKHLSDEQKRFFRDLFREARKAMFGDEDSHPEDYGCGSNGHKKFWDMTIDMEASWEANKPDWYTW